LATAVTCLTADYDKEVMRERMFQVLDADQQNTNNGSQISSFYDEERLARCMEGQYGDYGGCLTPCLVDDY